MKIKRRDNIFLNCCYNCKDRQMYCHINCEKYKAFQIENEIRKNNMTEYRRNISDYINMLCKENKKYKN